MTELLPGQRKGSPWGWATPKFDYYSASVHAPGVDLDAVVAALLWQLRKNGFELLSYSPCKAKNGYLHGVKIHRGNRVFAEVWSGGNPGVHVQVKGHDSRVVVPAFRAQFPEHSLARGDVCLDWISKGLFDLMVPQVEAFALEHELSLRRDGDWARGQGRTLYVGSSRSNCYICIYEKGWKEGGSASKDWVRFEVRVSPHASRKAECATWEETQFLGAAAWVAELVELLDIGDPEPMSVGRPWRDRDKERARLWFLSQGKGVIREWLAECGGCPADFGESVVHWLNLLESDGVSPEVGEPIGWFTTGNALAQAEASGLGDPPF